MTEKQIERVRTKIKKIRYALAAEKRKFGWYDDSRGMRYIPPGLFIKIGDFKGGLTYLKWFEKNFPDDICSPGFLFEWTIILFENGNITGSERKALQAFFSNTYIFDSFFGREIIPVQKSEYSNLDVPEFCDNFYYSDVQKNLSAFSNWLAEYEETDKFKTITSKYIELNKLLINERDIEIRKQLLAQERELIDF